MNTRLGFPPTAITEAGEYCLDLQYMQELTLANLEDEEMDFDTENAMPSQIAGWA